jgi:uncharacterized protein YqjF (DUF2071 family)
MFLCYLGEAKTAQKHEFHKAVETILREQTLREKRSVNPRELLKHIDHRTAPLPRSPWIMTQIWHELLFAHWPLAPEVLRSLIPSVLKLDTFEQQAWLGIVPFRMSHVTPRGIPPIPILSKFHELNVRTYVTVNGIPGIYFFSLDAANPLAVIGARVAFHLPYFNAIMSSQRTGDTICYRSHRIHPGAPSADLIATYRPTGLVTHAQPGTLVHWFTERYCLYTVVNDKRVYRGAIHHLPWPLQAAELEITRDTMARSHAISLPDIPPLLHYSERQEVLIWPLHHVL